MLPRQKDIATTIQRLLLVTCSPIDFYAVWVATGGRRFYSKGLKTF